MKLFTIFGKPVSHSISPRLHNSVIEELNLDACYGRYQLENGEEIINKFKSLKLDGANVTVPHKEWAYKKCDDVKGIATEIEAVNTLVKERDKVIGYNTDALGFYKSIEDFEGIKNVLVLGAGGTTKAIALILKKYSVNVTILNRSEKRLSFFKERNFETFNWDSFEPKKYDLIINATSAGLNDDFLPLERELLLTLLSNASYAFDVIYGKDTPFLKLAKSNNLTCKDGKDMLLYQAVLAFELFYKNEFSPLAIENAMRRVL